MKEQIINLRSEGKTYDEIAQIVGCSKSTVCYHCGKGQKDKSLERQRRNRASQHPFQLKIEKFCLIKTYPIPKPLSTTVQKRIYSKMTTFSRTSSRAGYSKPSFTIEEVLDKIGENPVCYLTGEPIDINNTGSYHFDHIIPRSRGGDNSLDNLGICTREANLAKHDMTPDELIKFCQKVIDHHK